MTSPSTAPKGAEAGKSNGSANQTVSSSAASPSSGSHGTPGMAAAVLGSMGVVFGDIGTSPLYALRESLHHTSTAGATRAEVLGIVSLLIWAVIITVTFKYVLFIMRADNKGEGGTLSLMALAQGALGRRTNSVLLLGVVGAALFYGDAVLTPAISVLSAVEGLKLVSPVFDKTTLILPIATAILVALFVGQSYGTQRVASFFGPIMALWFLVLAILGLLHIGDDLQIFEAIYKPWHAISFLLSHGKIGFIVMGAVFLAVTGGEALYADMGHFGRRPIQIAWMSFVMPALILNYLGQGAMVLANPETAKDPFFLLAPGWALLPLVILATAATVIASQAVITGAFSLTQQAIQLGLLPRLKIQHTSETQAGQIYLPQINYLLMVLVILLVWQFRSSSALASAYGIAVTGTMIVDTSLAFIVVWKLWRWPLQWALLLCVPILIMDLAFFSANLLKFFEGGYIPITFGLLLVAMMWTWTTGTRLIADRYRRDAVSISDLMRMLDKSKPHRVDGTAVYLTGDPDMAPSALLHNLKHNRVLHKQNIILTVRTSEVPRIPKREQIQVETISPDMKRIIATLGFMETPNVPRILTLARPKGIDFDIMQTSFFVARFQVKAATKRGLPPLQHALFVTLARFSNDATDFFDIPSGRVVWLGGQVTI
jgi:KUP system potassium uptake protein